MSSSWRDGLGRIKSNYKISNYKILVFVSIVTKKSEDCNSFGIYWVSLYRVPTKNVILKTTWNSYNIAFDSSYTILKASNDLAKINNWQLQGIMNDLTGSWHLKFCTVVSEVSFFVENLQVKKIYIILFSKFLKY